MPHPLLPVYEQLKAKIPYLPLGTFPTPVERLFGLEGDLGVSPIFIKRDDRSSDEYGGNKVRKLEFILAEALARKSKITITFGTAGSNHSLAVAVFAKRLGLKPVSLHIPQPNARYVRKNLLYQAYLGTELHHYRNMASIYAGTILVYLKYLLKTGRPPYVIPPGGSNTTGVMGMMGAVLELEEQVDQGILPEPEVLYVPLGSCGTAAGIALGAKALGWKTRIIAVRVSDRKGSDLRTVRALFHGAAARLRRLLPSFPAVALGEGDFRVCEEYLGDGYAWFTEKGMKAVRRVEEADGIKLEGTYSGKAMAALIDDATEGRLTNKVTVFWNTYNSADFEERMPAVDFRRLPKAYHAYFTKEDQPLESRSKGEGR